MLEETFTVLFDDISTRLCSKRFLQIYSTILTLVVDKVKTLVSDETRYPLDVFGEISTIMFDYIKPLCWTRTTPLSSNGSTLEIYPVLFDRINTVRLDDISAVTF